MRLMRRLGGLLQLLVSRSGLLLSGWQPLLQQSGQRIAD